VLFDPTAGSNSTLVASFDGQTPAALTAAEAAKLYEDFDRERELRSIAATMRQRTSVCG
jgi:hypothetical protein